MALLNRTSYKGYRVSRDLIDESDFTDLESDVSDAVDTPVGAVEIESDEFYRVGQGVDRGPEYTEGRIHLTLDNGSGAEPTDNARVKIVTLSSQNNVTGTITSGKYAQFSQGASDRSQRVPLPEQGPVVGEPKKVGVTVQEASGNSYTVDLSASDIQIDAIRGEK